MFIVGHVVANFNNLQTHPVCNVLSINEINPIYNTTWHRRIAVIVQNHPPVVRFGRKQESLIVLRVFRVCADSNLNVPGWPP